MAAETDQARRRPVTLRTRLIVVVVLTATALAIVLGVTSTLALRSQLLSRLDGALVAASERGQEAPGNGPLPFPTPNSGGLPRPPQPDWGDDPPALQVRGQATGTAVVEAVNGTVLDAGYLDAEAQSQQMSREQAEALLTAGPDPDWVDVPDLGRYRALAVERENGLVQVTALPWEESAATLRTYIVVEVLVAVAAVALAALSATYVVRRALRPLDRVALTAQRVSEQDLGRGAVRIGERVPARDTDERTEVGTVGAALNRLLGHVESSLEARYVSETKVRQFVADASHELRTPLASIRGYSELVLRRAPLLTGNAGAEITRAVGRVEAESRRMQALVEDLLLLARLDAGREMELTEVDLVAVAAEVTSDAHAAGPEHRWRLDLPSAGVVAVRGDEPRLRQVLVNLLANARAHTPPGTTVTTALRRQGDQVVVTVRDDGPGIAPELLPTVFDRFARGDSSRTRTEGEEPSSGLGLAIVQAIVAAHHGEITLDSSPAGTRVQVTIPAAG